MTDIEKYLGQIEAMLRGEGLFAHTYLQGNGILDLLARRDNDVFSSKWMAAYEEVERMKSKEQAVAAYLKTIDQIRKDAYLKSWERWTSPDLSAFVSDDFGLIADAVVVGANIPWVNGLFQCYQRGEVPDSVMLKAENSSGLFVPLKWPINET